MRNFIFAFVAVGAVACGPNCDSTAYADKLSECGVDVEPVEGGEGTEIECTDELATLIECQDGCISSADCGAFDGSDLDALTAYGECVAACSAT